MIRVDVSKINTKRSFVPYTRGMALNAILKDNSCSESLRVHIMYTGIGIGMIACAE